MQDWATEGSDGSPPASSIHWPHSSIQLSAMAYVMNTEYSASPSATAIKSSNLIIGCGSQIPGKSRVRR